MANNKKLVNGKKQLVVTEKKVTGKIVDVTDCPIDEDFMKTFEPQIAEVKKYVGKQIGNFKTTIYSRDQFFGSSAFNDFILNLQLQITKADISFNAPLQWSRFQDFPGSFPLLDSRFIPGCTNYCYRLLVSSI